MAAETASALRERERLAAMCGPEALAEVLRRFNRQDAKDAKILAREMGTSGLGTSVWAMVKAARKRGLAAGSRRSS